MKRTLAALLVLCAAQQASAASKKIGIINSITGSEAPIGEALGNGYRLAQEDLHKRGIDIDLITEDDAGKLPISAAAFGKLATRDRVAAIIGPATSAAVAAVVKLAERYKVPLLIHAPVQDDLTRRGLKYVFRINAPASALASTMLEAARHFGMPKSIALVYENTDYGTTTAEKARESALKQGLKVLADETYAKSTPDYRSMLTKVKVANADLVLMISTDDVDAILLMRQARELGLSPQAFLGCGAGFATARFAREREISEGVLISTQWGPEVNWAGWAPEVNWAFAREFAARYKKAFGLEPIADVASAYSSLMILGESVARVGDRERTRAALKAGQWNGIFGPVKFEEYAGFKNQNDHPVLVEQILNGKVDTVYPEELETTKAVYPLAKVQYK